MAYLHGVETIHAGDVPRNVSEVKTAIIGIVGVPAPGWKGEIKPNIPVVMTKQSDIEQFGPVSGPAFMPALLDKMYAQFDANLPIVIAVPVGVTTVSTAETGEPDDGVITLDHQGVGNVVVKSLDLATTYIEGTDYELNAMAGTITLKTSGAPTVNKKITYQYVGNSIATSDIIGSNSATPRTGIYTLLDAQTITGYCPKIIVAPGWSKDKQVADALVSVANKLKGLTYIDADTATDDTVAETVAARSATTKAFSIHEKRANLLFPNLKSGGVEFPMSCAAAGVRARVDLDPSEGYWWSISSHVIRGFDGLSIPVEYSVNNPSADSQLLNAAGIVTVKNVAGLKFCGNMNSSFDDNSSGGNTDHEIFEVTQTVGDVIEESIEYYSEQRIDKPITTPWINGLVRDVQAFLTSLTARGAIAGGRCWYDPDDNAPTDLMAGKIKFRYDDAATPPADRITYERSYNVEYLANLGK
ncbi:phage tail sheath subtilisin-like domain-containing protein [bacterium]|nr:phage tail sheath subtilisin-like domain-containing protein [bacterium]